MNKQFLVTDVDRNLETFWSKSLLYEYRDITGKKNNTPLVLQ